MKPILKKVHRYWYVASVGISFFILFPALYYFSRKAERYRVLNKFRYLFALLSSSLAGFLYSYRFEEKIDWSKSYIICPNHTSNLDVTAITLLMRSNFAFLGKDDLLKNTVTRLFFETIDIPLNRESKMSSFRAFKKAGEYVMNGMSLVIFPEGKIGEDYPPVLQSFKNGPFKLAIEYGIPIIPVTLHGAWKKMWDDGARYGSKPGICDIYVHKPVETKGLNIDNADNLRDNVYEIIKAELIRHEDR